MKCKFCKTRLQVKNCREYQGKIYRRRYCPNCNSDYYTEETECERKLYLDAVNYEKKMRDLAKLDKKTKV